MKSLANTLQNRRKSSYQKLKNRFVKKLHHGNVQPGWSTASIIERLRKIERQLGIRSSLRLRHWALAAALGVITTAASFKSKARGAYAEYASWYHRKNDLIEYSSAPNFLVVGDTASNLTAGPDLGDGFASFAQGVVQDFDGDGDLDFLGFSHYNSHTLFLNNGGVFDGSVSIPRDENTTLEAVVVDTLDADADYDFLVLENTGTGSRIQFFENDGTGNFNGDSTVYEDTSFEIKTLQIGDIDQDGDFDILTATNYGTQIYRFQFLVNEGTSFSVQSLVGLGLSYELYFHDNSNDDVLRLADFDGDGDLDLLVMPANNPYVNDYAGIYYEGFQVFKNDGSGNFSNSIVTRFNGLDSYTPFNLGSFDNEIQIHDVDNDGDLDVVTKVSYSTQIGVTLNDGSGLFGDVQTLSFEGYVDDIHTGNFDADDDLEILVAWEVSGFMSEQTNEIIDFDALNEVFGGSLGTISSNIGDFDGFAPGDFDGDGDDDILAVNYFDLIQFETDGGTFAKVDDTLVEPIWAYNFHLVDVDGDGDLDAVGDVLGQFLTNDGTGAFTLAQTLADSLGFDSELLAVGDFDKDGDMDLVIGGPPQFVYEQYEVSVYPFEFVAGEFVPMTPVVVFSSSFSYELSGIALGNLDSDPEQELVVVTRQSSSKYIQIHDFVTDNFDGTPLSSTNIYSIQSEQLMVFDVDGDGFNDIVMGTSNGTVEIFENINEDGSDLYQQPLVGISEYNNRVVALDTADLDSDGDLDLLIAYRNTDKYSHQIAYNESESVAFTWSTLDITFTNSGGVSDARFADFDNDGDQDIIFANYYDGDVFMENLGGGTFTEVLPAPYKSYSVAVGDVDGDGDIDILSAEYESGLSRVLFNHLLEPNAGPTFLDQTFSIGEDVTIGTSVAVLAATDPEEDVLTFTMLSGNDDGVFSLGTASGQLTVANPASVDFETTPSYSLVIEVTDGEFTVPATITINVTDVDEAPAIAAQNFNLNENVANGTVVGTVAATDPEEAALTFSIISGNTGGAFQINETSGQITVAIGSLLDFEATPEFELGVQVSDGTNDSSNTVTVLIQNVDEAPAIAAQSFNLNENVTNGTVVGTVVATDPEEAALTFTITSGNENQVFTLDETSGQLTVLDSTFLDFEATQVIELGVQVSDGINDSSSIVSVLIQNVDEAPAIAAQSFNLNENVANGTVVGTVAATDPEEAALTFTITSGNENQIFTLNETSGQLTVLDSTLLDFETTQVFELDIEVSDGTNNASNTITVELTDVNEAVQIVSEGFTLVENAENGTEVGTIEAIDPEGAALTFSITSGNENEVFSLNETSGQLTVLDSTFLDFETTQVFELDVQVSDGANNSSKPITITLSDINEAPVVSGEAFAIAENSPAGTVIGNIPANDPEGAGLSYSIVSGNETGAFDLDATSGELTIALSGPIDHEINPEFSLSIDVSDGENTANASFTVTIDDINEAPVIAAQAFSLPENSPQGASLGEVTATDPDSDPLSYTIVSGDPTGVFALDVSSGVLSIADSALFDFELQAVYTLQVQVSDGELTGMADVEVTVEDVLETNDPIMQDQVFVLNENPEAGAFVGVIIASDPNDLSLSFSILEGNESGAFEIEGNELIVGAPVAIDFESNEQFALTVQADNGNETTTASIVVNVQNVNEAPIIGNQVFRVEQGAANGTVLGGIKATDPEEDPLTFQITSGNIENTFSLDPSAGSITVSNSAAINFDENPDYELGIEVSDGAFVVPAIMSIRVTTLERDKTALLELFNATGGTSWTVSANWSSANAVSSEWSGVTVSGGRVTALALPANNIVGTVPESFGDLTGLTTVDLSGNEIDGFPDISSFANLTSLNLSNNRLGITDLLQNADVTGYSYAPQKAFGKVASDTIPAGDDYTVSIAGVEANSGNSYQWYLNAEALPGANAHTYQIQDIDITNMGRYTLEVQNTSLPDLTLTTRRHSVWAATDIFGTVFADGEGTVLSDGQVEIFRIFDGPYEVTDSTLLGSDGTYLIDNVVLGDFVVLVKPDRTAFPDVLQTYYESTSDWDLADTLFLYEKAEGIDIQMVFYEEPVPEPTGADFEGLVETNFEETEGEDDGRIDSRRKVKRAGCSMRRFVSTGRGEQEGTYELYAYVESDDEGVFNFEGIPEGTYLLNIQYPGVPMDPNSDIEFVIGGDKENQKFTITATITEDGISVVSREVLYSTKPYLKDMRLYPNPTDGVLRAEFLVYRRVNDLKMEILDVNGVKLAEQELSPKMGVQSARIDLTNYATGVYFIVFTDEADTFRQQIKIGKK